MGRFVTALVHAAVVSGRVPGPVLHAALTAFRSGAQSLSGVADSARLRELANIVEAIRLFAVSRFDAVDLAACDGHLASFGGNSARALSLHEATFEALWVLEGLGYRYAQRALRANQGPESVFAIAEGLPTRCRGIFHVGTTVAFAEDCLGKVDPQGVGDAVRSYLEICDNHAARDLRGIEAESLGFVTASLFLRFVADAAEALAHFDQALVSYFWHGVGRGLYLSNPAALGAAGRSWQDLWRGWKVGLDTAGEDDALEGYGWALGLINLRQPSVIRVRVDELSEPGGEKDRLSRGLREAFLCWLHWRGWDGRIDRLEVFAVEDPDWVGLATTLLTAQSDSAVPTYGAKLTPRSVPDRNGLGGPYKRGELK